MIRKDFAVDNVEGSVSAAHAHSRPANTPPAGVWVNKPAVVKEPVVTALASDAVDDGELPVMTADERVCTQCWRVLPKNLFNTGSTMCTECC